MRSIYTKSIIPSLKLVLLRSEIIIYLIPLEEKYVEV